MFSNRLVKNDVQNKSSAKKLQIQMKLNSYSQLEDAKTLLWVWCQSSQMRDPCSIHTLNDH